MSEQNAETSAEASRSESKTDAAIPTAGVASPKSSPLGYAVPGARDRIVTPRMLRRIGRSLPWVVAVTCFSGIFSLLMCWMWVSDLIAVPTFRGANLFGLLLVTLCTATACTPPICLGLYAFRLRKALRTRDDGDFEAAIVALGRFWMSCGASVIAWIGSAAAGIIANI